IPCKDGGAAPAPAEITEAIVVEVDPVVEVTAPPEEPAVVATPVVTEAPTVFQTLSVTTNPVLFPSRPSFVSAGNFPPFADGEGRGLMTDFVVAALRHSNFPRINNINPVSLPFDPLMASTDPDVLLSFPWVNPGCAETDFLSERSLNLCKNYTFSDKAYEIVLTFLVADRGGLAQAVRADQFNGKRICVPEQYPVNHLAEAGFFEPAVTIERGNSVAECIGRLLSGQTDVVNADYLSVEATYAVLSSQSIIVENTEFTWVRSVHAIAHNENQAGMQTLTAFNFGLIALRQSGEWLSISQKYLN
ncbi:MAG: transporter substrate-binding domain-containing protein, partial [Rhodobacteraceae bacterium]|nr:transporter substrate-binding domain-containing protein [Paracoccaceae bacterium]